MEKMTPFDKENNDTIPDIPVVDPETYKEYVIPNLIRCGAIPKSELIDGARYYGTCRNSSTACWHADKNCFTYERFKWGFKYPEDINHFEDDDGFDVFIPIKFMNYNYFDDKNKE